jgi:hemoglobin
MGQAQAHATATHVPQASPFQRVGGKAAVRALVDRFYDLMEADPAYAELRALHKPDLGPMRLSLTGFLIGWLGGPRDWFAENPGKCVMSAHRSVAIDAQVSGQWVDAMRRALADRGVDEDLADQINRVFGQMAQGMQNR